MYPHYVKYNQTKWSISFYEFLNIKKSQSHVLRALKPSALSIEVQPFTPPIPDTLKPTIIKRLNTLSTSYPFTIQSIQFNESINTPYILFQGANLLIAILSIITTLAFVNYHKKSQQTLSQLTRYKNQLLQSSKKESIVTTKIENILPLLEKSELIKQLSITLKKEQAAFYIKKNQVPTFEKIPQTHLSPTSFPNLIKVTISNDSN